MSLVIISEIKLTKKGRYALFCVGEFLFSIDEETLLRHHVKKGTELNNEELLQLRAASDYQKAKNKALDFLSFRDHSECELRQKLLRHYDEETAALAVKKVSELGLTNDRSFARRYAAELIGYKGKSKRETANKLREKGIDRELISEILLEYDDDETEPLKELIKKKYLSKLRRENGKKSVFEALMRKGFSTRDICAAMNEIGQDADDDIYEDL